METAEQKDVNEVFGSPDVDISKAFGADNPKIRLKIEVMAKAIAIEDERIVEEDKALVRARGALRESKKNLCEFMQQNGFAKVDLICGLKPKAHIKQKYVKAAGLPDEEFFQWLVDNNLGDIIKPTVHYMTMQSTLKNFNGELPENMITIINEPTITMYGVSNFLQTRKENQ